jgi:hypothetical protein
MSSTSTAAAIGDSVADAQYMDDIVRRHVQKDEESLADDGMAPAPSLPATPTGAGGVSLGQLSSMIEKLSPAQLEALDVKLRHARGRQRRKDLSNDVATKTFDLLQKTTAARRTLEMVQGKASTTILDRIEHVRTGHLIGRGLAKREKTRRAGGGGGGGRQQSQGSTAFVDVTVSNHAASGGKFEGYCFEEDESGVHFQMRAEGHVNRHELFVLGQTLGFVTLIGLLLGLVAATITACEGLLINARNTAVSASFATSGVGAAYAAFTGLNTLYILIAGLLTFWAPLAVTSGLPPLKAFLNGVDIPGLLTARTLLAKTVGVTFVVATGLPLGREGPMVHTGAIVASQVTRAKIERGPLKMSTPLEVRVPSAQRSWVGVGVAAGVAAAFNSPLGGILYSFEEVCSHWSEKMTWKSFVCVVIAAVVYNLLIKVQLESGGVLLTQGLVLGTRCLTRTRPHRAWLCHSSYAAVHHEHRDGRDARPPCHTPALRNRARARALAEPFTPPPPMHTVASTLTLAACERCLLHRTERCRLYLPRDTVLRVWLLCAHWRRGRATRCPLRARRGLLLWTAAQASGGTP